MFQRFICVFLVVALAACGNDKSATQATTTIGGAVAGGVVGSQFGKGGGNLATTALGVLLGAWAGDRIGASLNDSDRSHDRMAENRAYTAPIGQQVTWANPDTSASGTITPYHDGYSANGAYCRDFQQSVSVNGQQQQGRVKACQQPDGSWQAAR